MNDYCIYILSNDRNTVLYVGVTSDLGRRIWEHKQKTVPGFTKRYNVSKLVYFEQTASVEAAIVREKQLKGWTRAKKDDLIRTINSSFEDLIPDARDPSAFGPQDDKTLLAQGMKSA